MALLRGKLLAGALFAGVLFGAQDVQEQAIDQISPSFARHDDALLQKIRDKYSVIEHAQKVDESREAQLNQSLAQAAIAEQAKARVEAYIQSTPNKPKAIQVAGNEKQVLSVQSSLSSEDQAKELARIEQNKRNEIALILILSEV